MRNFALTITALCIVRLIAMPVCAGTTVQAYLLPSVYAPSTVFSLRANGKPIPVIGFSKQYDYAAFSVTNGPCELEVTRLDGQPIEHFSISPLILGLTGNTTANTLAFTMNKPAYLIVEVDKLRRLVIAMDLPETDRPVANGSGI